MLPPITMHGRVAVVQVLPATLDAVSEHESMLQVAEALSGLPAEAIVLSFEGIHWINSVMLGGLLSLCRRLGAAGQRVVLADLGENVLDVFRRTRLSELLQIELTSEDAVRRLVG